MDKIKLELPTRKLRFPIGALLFLSIVFHKVILQATPGNAEIAPVTAPVTTTGISPVQPAVTFAAYGDMPYVVKMPDGRTDDQVLSQDIAPKIRQRDDIPFVIHYGDLGRPEDACSDEWLQKVQTFWQNELIKPVFYTPGDNEWTDCDRPKLKNPKKETDRLQVLRKFFFSQPMTAKPEWRLNEIRRVLSKTPETGNLTSQLQEIQKVFTKSPETFSKEWRYETQSTLPENAIWSYNGVLFVTVHMVSTDNGRTEILLDDPVEAIKLVDERDKQNQIWLNRAFDLAKNSDTSAIVVTAQLDPFGAPIAQETSMSRCLSNLAYQVFCRQLQTLALGLNKPVLYLHGDTNLYCLDQPFDQAKNLWRLNAPGDFQYIDASIISVFPQNAAQPFKATGLLSGKPAPDVCTQ